MTDRVLWSNADPDADTPGMPQVWATVRCCREWVVCPYMPIGRCGICGERPT